MVFQTTITLEDRVKAVLSDFIGAGNPFTILDISNSVKKDGNGFVRHRDVRPIVTNLIDNEVVFGIEDYIVTQIQVSTPKGLEYANLYHLEDYDSDDYLDRQQKALSPSELNVTTSTTTSSIFTHSTPITQTTKSDTKSHLKDNARKFKLPGPRHDGAVEIPLSILQTAGLINEEVSIINHPNSISIVSASNTDTRTRKARSGMRLSKTCIKKSNLESHQKFEVAAFTGKIVIA